MIAERPEEKAWPPVLHQRWRNVGFVHWPVEPGAIAERLPYGVVPDLWEGRAWLTITPFQVEGERAPFLPPLPGISTYGEVNLRTYVLGPDGQDGLWFFSLDVANPITAAVARAAVGVPYRTAAVSIEAGGDGSSFHYRSERRGDGNGGGSGEAVLDLTLRVGDAIAAQSPLDTWLTGRWRAWTTTAGRLAYVPVRHEPWPLHRAAVDVLHESLVQAVGLPGPGRDSRHDGDVLCHFAPVVNARLSSPRGWHAPPAERDIRASKSGERSR